MKNIMAFLLAIVFIVSSVLFDSSFTKGMGFPTPFFHFCLAAVSILLLYLLNSGKIYTSREINICIALFFLITTHGAFATYVSGEIDIISAGSKVTILLFSAAMLLLGYGVDVSSDQAKRFGIVFFLITVLVAVTILVQNLQFGTINYNWLAITLLFSVINLFLVSRASNGMLIIFLAIISIVSYKYMHARGVSIVSGLGTLILLFGHLRLFPKINGFINTITLNLVTLISVITAVFGVVLYNSRWFHFLNSWSWEHLGKTLDSGRLERWNVAYEFGKESPIIGWGIDAHIARVSQLPDLGAIHSFWWEVAFRLGLIGVVLYVAIFFTVANSISRSSEYLKMLVFYCILIGLSSVYAVGGFTHWPGTFMFWFALGLMMKRSSLNIAVNYQHGESGR